MLLLDNMSFSMCPFQLYVGAMGPPGGGRNDITSRFTRHLQIVSIDEFDDNTMIRIFTSISDWHFSKGFDSSFLRMGKVSLLTGLLFSQGKGKEDKWHNIVLSAKNKTNKIK